MPNQTYPTDLTDSQWEHIKDLLPAVKARGRPRELELRQVVNAILYLVVGGIQWRMLPREYPCWQSVYYHFRQWQRDGTWRRVHEHLRARVRRQSGRHKHPTAGCLDSQTVRCSAVASSRGYDIAKYLVGRKRHVLVDTIGLLLSVAVTAASVTDREGARQLLSQLSGSCKKLRRVWVDGGYRGQLLQWVAARFRFCLQPVLRTREQAFVVLPRRWVVERTFAWFGYHRRLSRDYERLEQTSETMIYLAMTRLMLRRLKPL
jgi:putative transposase